VFGPILHVYRYDPADLKTVAGKLAARRYGLTLGVHSRIEASRPRCALVPAGNVYVNRSITGAVRRRPAVRRRRPVEAPARGKARRPEHCLIRYAMTEKAKHLAGGQHLRGRAAIRPVAANLGPVEATALAGACFGWGLLALALLDLRHFWLPDRIVLPLGLLGLAMGWFDLGAPFADRLIGAAVGFAALELIRLAYRALRHRDGLGAGDAKLFAAIGAWLGWHVLPAVMLVACLTGLMAASLLAVRGRRISAVSRLPLGLFLAIAAWVMWCATMSFVER
jgi:Flp pilus assembly protein protease CpaA